MQFLTARSCHIDNSITVKNSRQKRHKSTMEHYLLSKDCCNLFHLSSVHILGFCFVWFNLGFEYLQGSRLRSLDGQLVAVFDHPHSKKKGLMKARSIIHTNANPVIPIKLSVCKQSVIQSDSESHGVFSAMGKQNNFSSISSANHVSYVSNVRKFKKILHATQLISHTRLPKPRLLNLKETIRRKPKRKTSHKAPVLSYM